MTYLHKPCQRCCMGILLLIFCSILLIQPLKAQCDFINDITGITQSTPPSGNAANPTFYTHRYILVDNQNRIYAVGTTPDFLSVPAGNYNLYAINFSNRESPTVLPLLARGQDWSTVEDYGDDTLNCLDYTTPYGNGCPIVVCDEVTICEYETFSQTASGFLDTTQTQNYCLVCNDLIEAFDPTGTFDLSAFPNATGGANCQIYAINYITSSGLPLGVGYNWSEAFNRLCTKSTCFDFIGIDLDIKGLSQPSGNGISTTIDWLDNSDGCSGAQVSTNGGLTFNEIVNNTCVPSYNQGNIQARPHEINDDLYALAMSHARFACGGNLDLTQNTIFYTVECSSTGPSTLEVNITNPGGNITGLQAALYGPVDMNCPIISGGSFVDCDDSGTGATSGEALRDLMLSTSANPSETYLVIVDTEGKDAFTISSDIILLNTNLRHFGGSKEEAHNRLDWVTTSENDLHQFILERSNDAINFKAIATIQTIGEGNNMQTYQYLDATPRVGTKYYRLKLVHNDNTTDYSNIVALTRIKKDHLSYLTIVPNPSLDGIFNLEFEAGGDNNVDIQVFDVIGRSILDQQATVVAGVNSLPIDLGSLPAATYILSISINGHKINKRIVKAK